MAVKEEREGDEDEDEDQVDWSFITEGGFENDKRICYLFSKVVDKVAGRRVEGGGRLGGGVKEVGKDGEEFMIFVASSFLCCNTWTHKCSLVFSM